MTYQQAYHLHQAALGKKEKKLKTIEREERKVRKRTGNQSY